MQEIIWRVVNEIQQEKEKENLPALLQRQQKLGGLVYTRE